MARAVQRAVSDAWARQVEAARAEMWGLLTSEDIQLVTAALHKYSVVQVSTTCF